VEAYSSGQKITFCQWKFSGIDLAYHVASDVELWKCNIPYRFILCEQRFLIEKSVYSTCKELSDSIPCLVTAVLREKENIFSRQVALFPSYYFLFSPKKLQVEPFDMSHSSRQEPQQLKILLISFLSQDTGARATYRCTCEAKHFASVSCPQHLGSVGWALRLNQVEVIVLCLSDDVKSHRMHREWNSSPAGLNTANDAHYCTDCIVIGTKVMLLRLVGTSRIVWKLTLRDSIPTILMQMKIAFMFTK